MAEVRPADALETSQAGSAGLIPVTHPFLVGGVRDDQALGAASPPASTNGYSGPSGNTKGVPRRLRDTPFGRAPGGNPGAPGLA